MTTPATPVEPRTPNPDAVRRITAHLLGEDIVNLRAAVESFANGWTVVEKSEAADVPLRDYQELWADWQRYNDEATKAGSGFTHDQMIGASAMLSWLLTDHGVVAALAAQPTSAEDSNEPMFNPENWERMP